MQRERPRPHRRRRRRRLATWQVYIYAYWHGGVVEGGGAEGRKPFMLPFFSLLPRRLKYYSVNP